MIIIAKKLRGFIGCDISVALFLKEWIYLWFIYGRHFPECGVVSICELFDVE